MSTFHERFDTGKSMHRDWEPTVAIQFNPPEIDMVKRHFNHTPLPTLIDEMDALSSGKPVQHDEETGINFRVFQGRGDSQTDAIISINPIANEVSRDNVNMALRNYFLYLSAKEAGVRDEKGNPLPIIEVSAPAGDSTFILSENRRDRRCLVDEIREGNFYPFGEAYFQMTKRNFPRLGRVAAIGASFGGTMAPYVSASAAVSGIDATHTVSAQPVNVKQRSPLFSMLPAFASQDKPLKKVVAEAGITPFEEVHESDSMSGFVNAVCKQASLNWHSLRGLSRSTLSWALIDAAKSGSLVTVAYGTEDPVAPVDHLEDHLEHARNELSKEGLHIASIAILGAEHPWADDAALYAMVVNDGLTRAS